jgi:hypothetical protein
MKHYARVIDGFVTEAIDLPDGLTPSQIFDPIAAAEFIEAPAEVIFGWTYVDGEFIAPAV